MKANPSAYVTKNRLTVRFQRKHLYYVNITIVSQKLMNGFCPPHDGADDIDGRKTCVLYIYLPFHAEAKAHLSVL